LIVFARSPDDERLTSQGAYYFGHLSAEPTESNSFLRLSPLNHTLQVDPQGNEVLLESAYGLSYSYENELTETPNKTFTIPNFLGSSPQVLILTGWNSSDYFIEYTTFPQVPLQIGPTFEGSECYSFSYVVTINKVFYKLNIKSGGPSI
jgi:hypothetical protein